MSRTKRRLPYSYLRKMKGHKAALVREDRMGAVPPDPWEDVTFSHECYLPWTVAWRMSKDGHDVDEIAKTMNKTFGVNYLRALEMARLVVGRRDGKWQI